jgi:hypothetical protein
MIFRETCNSCVARRDEAGEVATLEEGVVFAELVGVGVVAGFEAGVVSRTISSFSCDVFKKEAPPHFSL